jgi:hypothetical protein
MAQNTSNDMFWALFPTSLSCLSPCLVVHIPPCCVVHCVTHHDMGMAGPVTSLSVVLSAMTWAWLAMVALSSIIVN